MPSSVAVLLVSRDGARWLPAVIDGIRAQRAPIARVVAVDTGSKDDSVALLTAAFGADGEILQVPGSTSFPAAVEIGLEHAGDADWIWILHDDANPDPGALEALVAAAVHDPRAEVLGPKLREWPSLRRLLELGVTLSGTGRRETGLERGEYDQGQHDEVREVLAVNTAGMLVRRRVLEHLGGFDPQLPIFGNDVDFGWRAAQAGHRTLVVPKAVVFHAEAAHRGVRRTPLTGRHTHYQERRAALYTLLANSRARALPWQVLRLGLGTLLRMIGLLLVRQVGQALDELAALVSLYGRPGQLLSARRARRELRTADPADVRRLLAPWWLPYRHGLDVLGDLVAAATDQAADVAERRRIAKAEAEGGPPRRVGGPGDPGDPDELTQDSGLVVRFLTSPVALTVSLVVVLALVGARDAFGSVAGGALSPVPDQARDWWTLHASSWHPLAQGTDVPAPAYVLPLALFATVLGGSPGVAISALLVLAVPLSLWGAWRFLRVVGRLVDSRGFPRWLLTWGAVTYALVPVVSGAWGEGRFGVVAVAVLLPWLAHAALGFADPEGDRRWRAAWRCALLFALGAAFAPVVFLFGAAVAVVVLGAGFAISPRSMRDRSVWGPPTVAMVTVPVLLLPWWLPALLTGAGEGLLLDAGRLPMAELGFRELLVGRVGESGAPWWLGVMLVALAALAVVPARTRVPVLVAWVVALAAAVVAWLASLPALDLAAVSTGAGLGSLVVVLQAAFLVAAVLGAHGALAARPDGGVGWRAAVTGVALVATVVPAAGLGWFVVGAQGRLQDEPPPVIPAYMVQRAETGPEHGVLVVRGDVVGGLSYTLVREDGTTLGEDEVVALAPEDSELRATLGALVSGPDGAAVEGLAEQGVEYVVLPAPVDGSVAAVLDATAGLTQASAEDRQTRAWQVGVPVDPAAVDGPGSWMRTALLVLQGLAIVVVLVLCAPSTRPEGRGTA